MSWCPKCKNEYREGIRVCADCGCELVSEAAYKAALEEEKRERMLENVEIVHDLVSERAKTTNASVDNEDFQESGEPRESTQSYIPYKKSAEKAEDNKSSAWMLLVVGCVGIVAMILGISGVIPINIGNPYMFYGVMSAVFLLFIVMGIVSIKNAKIFAKKAESENSLRETLEKWCREQLSAQDIDSELAKEEDFGSLSQEILYFRRYEKLKARLNHQFMNLDQAFLENMIDETIYDSVFGEDAGDETEKLSEKSV